MGYRDEDRQRTLGIVLRDIGSAEIRAKHYETKQSQIKRLGHLIEKDNLKLTIGGAEHQTPTAEQLQASVKNILQRSGTGYRGLQIFTEDPVKTLSVEQRKKYLEDPVSKGAKGGAARTSNPVKGTSGQTIRPSENRKGLEASATSPAGLTGRSSKAKGELKRRRLEADDNSQEDDSVSSKPRKHSATKGKMGTGRHASMPAHGAEARRAPTAATKRPKVSMSEPRASSLQASPVLRETTAAGVKRLSGQAFVIGKMDEEGPSPPKRLEITLKIGSGNQVSAVRQEVPIGDDTSDMSTLARHDANPAQGTATDSSSLSAESDEYLLVIADLGGTDMGQPNESMENSSGNAQLQEVEPVASTVASVPALAPTPGVSPQVHTIAPLRSQSVHSLIPTPAAVHVTVVNKLNSPAPSQPVLPTANHYPYGLRSPEDVEPCVERLVQLITTTADDIVEKLGLKGTPITFVPFPDRELELLYRRILCKEGECWKMKAAQLELQGVKLQHMLSACIGASVYEEVFVKKVPWTTSRETMLRPEMQARVASFNQLLSGLGATGPCANMEYLMYQSGADMLCTDGGFDVSTVSPAAQRLASSFLLTITAQLQKCMQPKVDIPPGFSEEITSALADIFRRALLLKGNLEEAPQEVRYQWAPTGTPFSRADMEEIRKWREVESVIACVFPGIARRDRDASYHTSRVQVYGRPEARPRLV